MLKCQNQPLSLFHPKRLFGWFCTPMSPIKAWSLGQNIASHTLPAAVMYLLAGLCPDSTCYRPWFLYCRSSDAVSQRRCRNLCLEAGRVQGGILEIAALLSASVNLSLQTNPPAMLFFWCFHCLYSVCAHALIWSETFFLCCTICLKSPLQS